jgi:hypothetical protein
MKTKNHSGHTVPALAIAKAANEDGFTSTGARDAQGARKPSWSPLEVWRTRVKDDAQIKRNEPA